MGTFAHRRAPVNHRFVLVATRCPGVYSVSSFSHFCNYRNCCPVQVLQIQVPGPDTLFSNFCLDRNFSRDCKGSLFP